MHIPDGYLSPATSFTLYAASSPFLFKASREINRKLEAKIVPMVSLFSALSFIIMMFNVPLPGGTTGHAVGATLISIVLGPWIAMLSVTVALSIQALFFGDGGILSLGANIFNMAIVMTLAGYAIFSFLDHWSKNRIRRKIIFSAAAGYVAINLSALFTATELGLQPVLYHSSSGQALYFPFSLSVSIPAMMAGHLTVAGIAEALITGVSLSWIYRTNPELISSGSIRTKKSKSFLYWGVAILGLLIFISPLGLLAPGTAWGEWGRSELAKLGLGYIPAGYDKWTETWKAPLKNYNLPLLKNPGIGYIFSGFTGVVITAVFIRLIAGIIRKIYSRRNIKPSKLRSEK